jgi:two-component system chemotaxis sensor kinase CheA
MAVQQASEIKAFEVALSDWAKHWATMVPELKSACRILDRSKDLDRVTISKTLNRLTSFIEDSHETLRSSALRAAGLAKDTNGYAHVAASALDLLMDETRQLLMMPCSSLFDSFPFLVRDLARQLKKEVEFTVTNSEVELDKRILQSIRDPLVHILRNSIDHGIEPPETRIGLGKPRRGRIELSVVQTDPKNIRITVRDDGGGIDIKKVKESAIRAGLHSAEELEVMSEEKLMALTFKSSLSTSETITEISGRGIGMAIVEENISNIGGKIHLESKLGEGTSVTILLPVTIATFRGLLVEASSRIYALPTTSVERVVRVTNAEIKHLTGALFIDLDGLLVPVCRLEDVLAEKLAPSESGSGYLTVCILSAGDHRIGVIVDDVQEEQEILVKPLGKVLSGIPNVSGLTILGSGQVVPVLNSLDLMNYKPPIVADYDSLNQVEKKKGDNLDQEILVVDDTLTARLLLTNLLETAGYKVDSARDAQEALIKLGSKKYCLVLTDVEMPKMNGFELTQAIRMRPEISKLPVIVVTSRSTNEYRERGVKAGADAFFVKGDLKNAGLLQMVESLV